MALNGNETMLRLFFEHMLMAKSTDEPIKIDIPTMFYCNNVLTRTQLGSESLKAIISGEITPKEATKMSFLICGHYKTFELIELWQRLHCWSYAWLSNGFLSRKTRFN